MISGNRMLLISCDFFVLYFFNNCKKSQTNFFNLSLWGIMCRILRQQNKFNLALFVAESEAMWILCICTVNDNYLVIWKYHIYYKFIEHIAFLKKKCQHNNMLQFIILNLTHFKRPAHRWDRSWQRSSF